jgi:hypothetical protein
LADDPINVTSQAMKKLLRWALAVILVPIIFFEEWGWKPMARAMARLADRPVVQRLEKRIAGLRPGIALTLFVVPALVLLPFKFGALWLIANDQKLAGIVVILAAKLISTALLGRLFLLTEPKLMSFAWFRAAYGWWRATKDRIVTGLKASAAWRSAAVLSRTVRAWWKPKR